MTPTSTVLVLGATGKTGRRLVPRLSGAGVHVRAAGRHPGDTGIRFDWHDPATHGPALAGAGAVYVVLPDLVADPSPLTEPFFALAEQAGVRRVVLLSSLGVTFQAQGTVTGYGKVERQLMASSLEWTILRPSGFDQNFSEGFLLPGILERGVIAAPTGDAAVPLVDADDVAAVAATTLTTDGHVKAEYALTGPEPITFAQAAEIISRESDRPVAHEDIPREALLAVLTGHGMPADYAEMIVSTFDAVRTGHATAVSDHVHQVTGRPATPFAAFAHSAADAWRAQQNGS